MIFHAFHNSGLLAVTSLDERYKTLDRTRHEEKHLKEERMLGKFLNYLAKEAIKALNRDLDRLNSMPPACKIVVVDTVRAKWEETIELIGKSDVTVISKHLHDEGVDAGKRFKRIEKSYTTKWLWQCQMLSAHLCQSLYHCAQHEQDAPYAFRCVTELAIETEGLRTLYKKEIEDILSGKATIEE